MTAAERQLVRDGVARASARLDQIEERMSALERLAFELDEIERRMEALEDWLGPRAFSQRSLARQRHQAIRQARSRGMSVSAISRALGVSQGTVKSAIRDMHDPPTIVGVNGARYPSRQGRRGAVGFDP